MLISYKSIIRVIAIVVIAGINIFAIKAEVNGTINFSLRYNPSRDRVFNGNFKIQITRMTWKNSAGQQCAPDDLNPVDTGNNPLIFPSAGALSFNKVAQGNEACYLDNIYFKVLSPGSTASFALQHNKSLGIGIPGCENGCQSDYIMKLAPVTGWPKELMAQNKCLGLATRGKITNSNGQPIGRITSLISNVNKVVSNKYPCPIYP